MGMRFRLNTTAGAAQLAGAPVELGVLADDAQCAFRAKNYVGSASIKCFEAQFLGLQAPCVRFAARVAPGPRNTRFRWVVSPCNGLSPVGFR
jgi:hypothetical protein